MILNSYQVACYMEEHTKGHEDPLVMAPRPNLQDLKSKGSASIDLRLGTWFISTRTSRHPVLDVTKEDSQEQPSERSITAKQYVPFGRDFVLHPSSFVLAGTLEWIRMPRIFAGYVTGRSSWGRRGLVIETAPGVHPGFSGCLTLELANVGEIPIRLFPGMTICQLFIHRLEGDPSSVDQSAFIGRRQPILGKIKPDDFCKKLMKTGG